MLLGGMSPPFTPLVAAYIKRAMPFRGSSLLSLVLRMVAREKRALTVPFPRTCLHPVCAPCLQGVIGAVPVTLGLHGGWVAFWIVWHQYSVLAAR